MENSNYIEVEQKFRLSNPDRVLQTLRDLGSDVAISNQKDVYYNAPHKDFLAGDVLDEWLRLRTEDNKATINFKRWLPLGAAHQTHCDEYESIVDDPEALRQILESLDFREIVTVNKIRHSCLVGECEVALDEVTGLGSFIEVEYKGTVDSVDDAHRVIEACLGSLGAETGPRDRRGYPYQLLGRDR